MKKNGYTLAEALISLAVIGVVAALILPMANKLKPDTTKIVYLKTYDSIVQITQQLASNNQVYPLYNNNIYYEQYPLANLSAWTYSQNNQLTEHTGYSKYCTLLADAFGASSNECSDTNELSAVNSDFSQPSFTSTIGVVFDIRTMCHISDKIEYQSDIYIDIDGVENGNNCYYNFDDCTQPDRFKIIVASNAKTIASDSKGQYYLNTRADSKLIKDLDNLAAQDRYPERNLEEEDRTKDIF